MSADNWAICPRCLHEAQAAATAERERVQALYGQVELEEFEKQRAALSEPDDESFRTFREDYEIYDAETGTVQIDYRGGCTRCGTSAVYTDAVTFWAPPATVKEQSHG